MLAAATYAVWMKKEGCLFCSIASGDIPAEVVYRGGRVLAFRDIAPVAPTHVLVIPLDHFENVAELAGSDPALVAEVVRVATQIAEELGVAASGYRVVLNTGDDGGQTVQHVHAHLFGGRPMTWPPG